MAKTHPLLMILESADPDLFERYALTAPLSAEAVSSLVANRTARVAITCERVDPVLEKIQKINGKCEAVIKNQATQGEPAVVLADVPLQSLRELAAVRDVRFIYPSVKTEPALDKSVPALWPQPPGHIPTDLDGQGIVVGIVDSGIDWSHEDFRKPDGTTRITHLLVQRRSGNLEYTAAEINDALKGNGFVPSDDEAKTLGHGTHVAGIAAGNGRASGGRFKGLAHGADLIIVRTDYETNGVEAGVQWIFDKAGNAPAVVNVSLGTHLGPHDGSSAFEKTMENLAGPGRIIFAAAGNEGDSKSHSAAAVRHHWVTDFVIDQPAEETPPKIKIDCWIPAAKAIQVRLRTPAGDLIQAPGFASYAGAIIALEQANGEGGDLNVLVLIEFDGSATSFDLENWSLIFDSADDAPSDLVHCWIFNQGGHFTSGIDPHYLLEEPANSRGVLAVGAFISRNGWDSKAGMGVSMAINIGDIAFFSSNGPTRDGREKPEVTCPGLAIISCLSKGVVSAIRSELVEPSEDYQVMQGTSQAAPHLTGAVALLLQRHGKLTPDQVRDKIAKASYSDSFTRGTWNDRWGYGKLSLSKLLA